MRETFVDVRGLRLHVREWPGQAGTPVVLLHGWLDQCGSFDLLAPLLARDPSVGTLYALDFRGHGDSAWVGPGGFYHFTEYVADLDGALDALALPPSARVVGHSLGGAVGLLHAAARPGRVAHLSLLDALPMAAEASEVPDRFASWLDDLKKPRARRTVPGIEHAASRLTANSGMPEAVALHLAAGGVSPDPAQGGALAWKWDPLLRAHSPLPVLQPVLQALFQRVRTPTFVLRAGRGYLADEDEVRGRLAAVGPARIEVIEGATHHLHIEQPDEVALRLLSEWRRGLGA